MVVREDENPEDCGGLAGFLSNVFSSYAKFQLIFNEPHAHYFQMYFVQLIFFQARFYRTTPFITYVYILIT
jgi:hypothetical protein